MLKVDTIPILGPLRLARKAAHPLQEPSQEVWRHRSRRYVKSYLEGLGPVERERYIRSKRDNAQ